MKIKSNTRKKMSEKIAGLGTIRSEIPLAEIDSILRAEGYLLCCEDGTEWEGFLCGREGRAMIDFGNIESENEGSFELVDNSALVLTWFKFDTGRYDVVCYLS